MKAIVQDTYGSADVLELRDIDTPTPGPDEVLIRVRAAGVDRGVWHLMTGLPRLGRLAFGLRTPKNPVLGADVAGVVEAVGANVTEFGPGDEVFGTCSGAFAEYVCAKAAKLAPKPASLTFEQAAAVPVSGCTALQALRDTGNVQAGQRVLVIGAGGGVGTYAVQLAKAFGAHVTGVCSTGKVELVRDLGADEVVDYTRGAITGSYDLVLDIAGNRPLTTLRALLTPRGTLVIVGGEGGGAWFGGIDRQLRATLLSPFTKQQLGTLLGLVRKADLITLTELIEARNLTPAIDRSFPLIEAAAAIRRLESGSVRGKVVISV